MVMVKEVCQAWPGKETFYSSMMNLQRTAVYNIHLCYSSPLPTCRLNLTPTPREKRTRSRTQQATERDSASKRQRLEESSVSSHAAGFIQISDVDPDGKFVQVKNMSNQVSVVCRHVAIMPNFVRTAHINE